MSPSRRVFKDSFIPRLLCTFNLSTSSLNSYIFHSHRSIYCREQYFRFDSEFDGPEPVLDDTTKIYKLKAAAQATIYKSKDIDRVASCVIGQYFVFELESKERKEDGQYTYIGHILYRLQANGTALGTLLDQLIRSSAKLSI